MPDALADRNDAQLALATPGLSATGSGSTQLVDLAGLLVGFDRPSEGEVTVPRNILDLPKVVKNALDAVKLKHLALTLTCPGGKLDRRAGSTSARFPCAIEYTIALIAVVEGQLVVELSMNGEGQGKLNAKGTVTTPDEPMPVDVTIDFVSASQRGSVIEAMARIPYDSDGTPLGKGKKRGTRVTIKREGPVLTIAVASPPLTIVLRTTAVERKNEPEKPEKPKVHSPVTS